MAQAELKVGRKPLVERQRQPNDALAYSVSHWIRAEALAILHEGEFCAGEVADILCEDVKLVSGHIRDLYRSGCIEFAGYKTVGNLRKPAYRAVVLPFVSDDAYRAMSTDERHDLNGVIVQDIFAMSVSSYRTGQMDADEDLYIAWHDPMLDAQGQRELHDYLAKTSKGVDRIHARAAKRMAKSGEKGSAKIVAVMGFGRAKRRDQQVTRTQEKITGKQIQVA